MGYKVPLITVHPPTLDTNILFTNLANCGGDDPVVTFLGVLDFILPGGEGLLAMDADPLGVFFILVSLHNVEESGLTR